MFHEQLVSMIANNMIKYLIEGFAVALAGFYIIPDHRRTLQEVAMLGFTAAIVMMVLDMYSPGVAGGFRKGFGFGLGAKMAGFPAA